jgi:hypothetical protein
MNHDELRSTIQHYNWVESTDLIKALDAVVKLHKPVMAFTGGYDGEENELWAEQCQECSGNGFSQMYPCTTIQAIEKELK